jgi:hypothetical protein
VSVSVRGEFASVRASAVMLWRCANIFAAMMQAPAAAAASAVRASQAAATVAAKASQAAGIGVRVCVRASVLAHRNENLF